MRQMNLAVLKSGDSIVVGDKYHYNGKPYFKLPCGGCISAGKIKHITPQGKPIYSKELATLKHQLASRSKHGKARKG